MILTFLTENGNNQHNLHVDKFGLAFIDGMDVYDCLIDGQPVEDWHFALDGTLVFNGKNVYESKISFLVRQ